MSEMAIFRQLSGLHSMSGGGERFTGSPWPEIGAEILWLRLPLPWAAAWLSRKAQSSQRAILRQQFLTRTALSSSTSWRPTIAFDVVFVFVTSLSVNDDIRQSVYGFFECNLVKSPVNAKYQVSPVRRILLQLKPW